MEKTYCFGKWDHLVGVYSQPDSTPTGDTAVLMLTAGMLHHVGPMGLHVELAARLRESSIASLRFDLSGIGESLAVSTAGSSLNRAGSEIRDAMDWLQSTHGFKKFHLFGLCSGADDALAFALEDTRIASLSLLDGCGYRTPRFHWERLRSKYMPRVFSPAKWCDLVRRLYEGEQTARAMPWGSDIREFPSREVAESWIRRLLERGVTLQCLYTGGVVDYYSYADQFFDMFPSLSVFPDTWREQIDVGYYPEMDHLSSLRKHREILLQRIVQWVVKSTRNESKDELPTSMATTAILDDIPSSVLCSVS